MALQLRQVIPIGVSPFPARSVVWAIGQPGGALPNAGPEPGKAGPLFSSSSAGYCIATNHLLPPGATGEDLNEQNPT